MSNSSKTWLYWLRRHGWRRLERRFSLAPVNQSTSAPLPGTIQSRCRIQHATAEVHARLTQSHFHAAMAAHGALYFKPLDDAAYFAAASIAPVDKFIVTTSLNLRLLRPIVGEQVLRAVAFVRSGVDNPQSLIVADGRLYDAKNRLCGIATAEFVFPKRAAVMDDAYLEAAEDLDCDNPDLDALVDFYSREGHVASVMMGFSGFDRQSSIRTVLMRALRLAVSHFTARQCDGGLSADVQKELTECKLRVSVAISEGLDKETGKRTRTVFRNGRVYGVKPFVTGGQTAEYFLVLGVDDTDAECDGARASDTYRFAIVNAQEAWVEPHSKETAGLEHAHVRFDGANALGFVGGSFTRQRDAVRDIRRYEDLCVSSWFAHRVGEWSLATECVEALDSGDNASWVRAMHRVDVNRKTLYGEANEFKAEVDLLLDVGEKMRRVFQNESKL